SCAALGLGGDREVHVLVTGHGRRVHDLFEHLELDVLVRLDDGDPVEVLAGVKQLVVVLQGHQLVVKVGDLEVTRRRVLHQLVSRGHLRAVQSHDVLADADDRRALQVRPVLASGSTMFFWTNRISPVAEKDISRKMTNIVIMSMYATRFSGAYRLLRPACPSLAFATSRVTEL